MAPFMFPSASVIASAVCSSKRWSSSACRSADANTLRARCSAYCPPALAPIPAIAALRAAREVTSIGAPGASPPPARRRAAWTAVTPAVAAKTTPSSVRVRPQRRAMRRAYVGPPRLTPADRPVALGYGRAPMSDVDSINLALLAFRCCVGAVMLAHGINHIFGGGKIEGTGRWFESLGMTPGRLHAWLASLTEVVGGAMLVLGLLMPLTGAAE